MNWTNTYIVVFVIQYVLIYSSTLGYFQGKYPRVRTKKGDLAFALGISILMAAMPGIGLLIDYCLSGFYHYGFKFVPEGPIEDGKYGYDIFDHCRW